MSFITSVSDCLTFAQDLQTCWNSMGHQIQRGPVLSCWEVDELKATDSNRKKQSIIKGLSTGQFMQKRCPIFDV